MQLTLTRIKSEIHSFISSKSEEYKNDHYQFCEQTIKFISTILQHVKEKHDAAPFKSTNDEIFYFKHIKCYLLASIQHYEYLQNIEFEKPKYDIEIQLKFYRYHLKQIKKKLKEYNVYYRYFRAQHNYRDEHYFKQINEFIYIRSGDFLFEVEQKPQSPSVHIFTLVEAHDRTRLYLKKTIRELKLTLSGLESPQETSKLKWTSSKTDLIELIYALHASGALNNGKAELKEIALHLQQMFDTDLGQYNRIFYDIRARKGNKTKFIQNLKEALEKRMKDTDNELFA